MLLKIKVEFTIMVVRRYTLVKILFIHNTAMGYRRPFFKKLSEIYDIKFIFTHIHASKDIYSLEISNKIEGLEGVNYKILKNYLGIAFGVLKESMADYQVLIGGNWDNLPELIETLIFFTISKIRRKKYVIWSEEWEWEVISLKKRLIKPIIKLLVKKSDAIIVPGTKHKEYFVSLGAIPEKVFLMPNASNIIYNGNSENISKIKEKYGIENKKIILYVGRLIKRKGIEYLIQAFYSLKKDINDTVLMIIGDGECKNELQSLSKDLKIEEDVYFIGNVENEKLPSYYLLADICIVPSVTLDIGDPWVFVLNEAMYFEKPVIATDAVGAAFDMIQNGKNGFIVPEKDSESLYKSMKEILSKTDLKESMGIKSKTIIKEKFRYKNMVDGFKDTINYLLS
jgi:glycosyltransferase involved in cell wall biosynthesis